MPIPAKLFQPVRTNSTFKMAIHPVSVIIPTFNSEEYIRPCLTAIFASDMNQFEVIVVDDGSCDRTLKIVNEFPCRPIRVEQNAGCPKAKNTGAQNAQYEILVFVDSDIIVKSDTLNRISRFFSSHQGVSCITGLLSKEHPHKNFFSQYKNLYMHYIFRRCPEYVDFLYGSICAVNRNIFSPYNEHFTYASDTELGMRLSQKGHKIFLDKKLEVVHLKRYSFVSLLVNDFRIASCWAQIMVSLKTSCESLKNLRFAHARFCQILSIFLVYTSLFLVFLEPLAAAFLILLFMLLNYHFFIFLSGERGIFFLLASIGLTYVDLLVMGAGIIWGLLREIHGLKRYV